MNIGNIYKHNGIGGAKTPSYMKPYRDGRIAQTSKETFQAAQPQIV